MVLGKKSIKKNQTKKKLRKWETVKSKKYIGKWKEEKFKTQVEKGKMF